MAWVYSKQKGARSGQIETNQAGIHAVFCNGKIGLSNPMACAYGSRNASRQFGHFIQQRKKIPKAAIVHQLAEKIYNGESPVNLIYGILSCPGCQCLQCPCICMICKMPNGYTGLTRACRSVVAGIRSRLHFQLSCGWPAQATLSSSLPATRSRPRTLVYKSRRHSVQ